MTMAHKSRLSDRQVLMSSLPDSVLQILPQAEGSAKPKKPRTPFQKGTQPSNPQHDCLRAIKQLFPLK